ncbi:MAG: nuclear transport factor 2 family protein [Acidimicrobiales bacterium]|jgi:hypothetical protein|nr:nuclear transport factor 2 family protein [Acidimicrobiales bacterium]
MSDLWEHSERVSCTHPGWPPLHGWSKVVSSWFSLFQGPQQLQFILTGEHAHVAGDVGWVSVEENILDVGQSGTVAALNLFVRAPEGWRLVAHHGSPVSG